MNDLWPRRVFLLYDVTVKTVCICFPVFFCTHVPVSWWWRWVTFLVDIAAGLCVGFQLRMTLAFDEGRFVDDILSSTHNQIIYVAAIVIAYSLLHMVGVSALFLVFGGAAWQMLGPVTILASLVVTHLGMHFDDVHCRATDAIRDYILE
jgi:hypothetical protein